VHDSQFGSDAFPRPIPRRIFLAAKRRSAGALPVTAVGIRWPRVQVYDIGFFMSYPKDRSTPRAASSSPSGPTMIMVETPYVLVIDATRAVT
jgi:hypothetical protein